MRNIDDNMVLSPSYLKTTAKVFQGGTWGDLHRMLAVSSGDKILYVGDHTYADILRSKRTLGWRTCLIIPELEGELQIAERLDHDTICGQGNTMMTFDLIACLLRQREGSICLFEVRET